MTDQGTDKTDNSPFDWEGARRDVGASEKQMIFARAVEELGCSYTEGARRAGYAGDDEALRKAGSEAARIAGVTKLVQRFRNAGEPSVLPPPADRKEMRARLSQKLRSGDVQAANALIRLDELEKDEGTRDEFDGRGAERLAIDFARQGGAGAMAYALLFQADSAFGKLSALPMLHLIASTAVREYPEMWAALRNRCDGRELDRLDAKLLDDEHQTAFFADLSIAPIPLGDRLLAAGARHADARSANGSEANQQAGGHGADGHPEDDSEAAHDAREESGKKFNGAMA